MEKHWLVKERHTALVIFALGWASDSRLVEQVIPEGHDVLCLYDYRTVERIRAEETAGYKQIYLFAWSFGVWVAEQVLKEISLTQAIALNGTPYPVNDTYGISKRIFKLTLRGITTTSIDTFNRRAFGEYYHAFGQLPQPRPIDVLVTELNRLYDASSCPYMPRLNWDHAIIGKRDAIFPPENMKNYWGEKALEMDLPHFPFGNRETILTLLERK